MRLTFMMSANLYDCEIKIIDQQGYHHHGLLRSDEPTAYFTVDVYGNELDLDVIPIVPNTSDPVECIHQDWNGKLARNANFLRRISDNMFLRVGCQYHITDLQDGDRLDIAIQSYPFGLESRIPLINPIPLAYMFFEVSCFKKRYEPVSVYQINRDDVLNAVRAYVCLDVRFYIGLEVLFNYPVQISRARWLTSSRKIQKTIAGFYRMTDDEHKRLMDQMDKMI